MSNANYKKNPHIIYYIKYTHVLHGRVLKGQGVSVNPVSEEAAIKEVISGLIIKNLERFEAWVENIKEW